ncbi:MAG: hypothetical protein KKC30_12795 [Proteobacteria bacterium]|nr:hypothetical protein [Pseudomonadota bacterium]MBU4384584.1 hypothetical protein [Pseudomonadota bacterium]MBU4606830.1 hypothetical protein [Pseudomonadota bacterium]MCG2766268.1 hypothetical protein [Desulfarculaceae bacterium]
MEINYKEQLYLTRFGGVGSAIVASIMLVCYSIYKLFDLNIFIIISAFLLIPLCVFIWRLMFHGLTIIAMNLTEEKNKSFQMAISILFPILISFYFISKTPEITFKGMTMGLLDIWIILPIGIIILVSWVFGEQVNKKYWFRSFIGSSLVLFFVCLYGYWGFYSIEDELSESSVTFQDKEEAAYAAKMGLYMLRYLVFVAVSYLALLVRMKSDSILLENRQKRLREILKNRD